MKTVRMILASLVLTLFCITPAYTATGDLAIDFDDAVVTLTQAPCDLGSGSDPESEMKGGQVAFVDGRPALKLCWLVEGDVIWLLDEQLQIIPVDKVRARPADALRKVPGTVSI